STLVFSWCYPILKRDAINVKVDVFFFLNHTPTTEIYTTRHTLSLHDALPISRGSSAKRRSWSLGCGICRPGSSRSEEHTSELQSRLVISYAVFCLKKKKV